jgi:hypothetical protein
MEERKGVKVMSKKTNVQVAFLVPQDFASGFHPQGRQGSDASVERKTIEVTDEDRKSLGFEPITTGALLWVSLKIVGTEALKCAIGIVIKELHQRWKEYQQEPRFITLRFPDGYSQQLDMTKPLTRTEVEELLGQHGLL